MEVPQVSRDSIDLPVLNSDDRDLVYKFFVLFMRFEFALKRAGFLKNGTPGAPAMADWKSYAETLRGRLGTHSSDVMNACKELFAHPPGEQIMTDDLQLGWRAVSHRTEDSEEWRVLRLVKTVRNNLFHGGKYADPSGPVAEPARDGALLRACVSILEACLDLSPQLRDKFSEAA